MQIVKSEKSERWIVCFVKEELVHMLNKSLIKAKKLIDEYERERTYVQDWLEDENTKLKLLYEELECMREGLNRQKGDLISFFPKG